MIKSNVVLIIPSCNAGEKWGTVLNSINMQSIQPGKKILLDSASRDTTISLAAVNGFEIHHIHPDDFNHGLTRQAGVDHCLNAEFAIMMTQDSVLATNNSFANLLTAFDNPKVAAAYGRQLPDVNDSATEKIMRNFNYPPESALKTLEDTKRMGIKTPFCSNSFAAWRINILKQAGGFSDTNFGEDMLAAAKLLMQNHAIAYCAEATVFHSHSTSLGDEFRRGRSIGHMHRQNPWLLEAFGHAEVQGVNLMRWSLSNQSGLSTRLSFLVRALWKFTGYQAGRHLPIFKPAKTARYS